MKFTFNLGNMEIRQERNNWKENERNHYKPAREMKLENVQLGIEFEVEEMIQMCKSSDLTVIEGIKLIKELGPQFMDILIKKEERKDNLERENQTLRNELESARSCKNYIKERYNELKGKIESTSTKLADDRELY